MRDACLHPLFGDVQDRHGRRLGARARGRRDGQKRLQRARRGLSAADGGVDVVHDLTAVRRYEVRDLRRVDARSAADRDEPVEVSFLGEVRRRLKRVVRRFNARAVPHLDLYALGLDQLDYPSRYVSLHDAGVRDEHHPPDAHPLQLPARLFRGAGTVLQRRRLHRKDRLVVRPRAVAHVYLPFPSEMLIVVCTRSPRQLHVRAPRRVLLYATRYPAAGAHRALTTRHSRESGNPRQPKVVHS